MDERAGTLEEQVLMPILDSIEMGQRSFLLTGEKAPTQHFQDLEKYIQSGGISQEDLDTVQNLVNSWLEKAANPEIDAHRNMNQYTTAIKDMAQVMTSGPGKKIMDDLHTQVDRGVVLLQ